MDPYPSGVVPYCGAPPAPEQLVSRWNTDPVLIATLVVLLILYLAGARRRPEAVTPLRRRIFVAGWLIGGLALVSPLCPLSVSLFSARVAQHMVLTLVAAPLLALGRPVAAYAALAGRAPRRAPDTSLAAGAAFAVLLWFWHAPRPYTDTFLSTAVYWSMHLSLIGSAIWLWAELIDRPPSGGRIAAAGLSMVQMSLLGAILTLSQRALFPPHQLTTAAWGLTQLQDQALGGAIMWVPGGVIFLGVLLAKAWRLVQPSFAEGGALAGAGAALVPTEAPARP